jgi:large subunit ribosomal protein L21
MYAVIETGGKQYRVEEGDIIDVELLSGETGDAPQPGAEVAFDRVLMVGGDDVKVGSPVLSGASVRGSLLDHVRGPKIRVFKKKRRKGYRRTNGHRQDLRRVRIVAIEA